MCGIFGLHYFDRQKSASIEIIQAATDSMYHRGPDDAGYFLWKNIGLGHRRLSIIDLASGHQPMVNEDGSIVVVFNGEIYNYKEIKKDLQLHGHHFRTDCDTEIIVHSYEQWGVDCLQRFNGMFAFVLADISRCKMWIVRDRLGIKPLYYYYDKSIFIVASEIKALLKTGMIRSSLNENVLDAYFSVGYVPGPETMFKGIKKVMPGHYMVVHKEQVKEVEYWDFSSIDTITEKEVNSLERIGALLQDSVRQRLISDVPVGAFLSGGLDSSLVVGTMAKLITPQPVNTFTVAYPQGYSEEVYAQIVANQFQTNHHVFHLEAEDFFSSLKTLVHFAEEPLVEPAAIALYHISKLARQHAIVLLSGEGSDEIFGGYALYQSMARIENFSTALPLPLRSLIARISCVVPKLKQKKYLDWLQLPLSERYRGTSSYLTPSIRKFLYSPDFFKNKSSYLDEQFDRYFQKVAGRDPIQKMLYVDTKTWLADNLLVKADKMTMAASIELRVPFLDYRLVEAATSLPLNMKIQRGQGKYLVKKIAKTLLPDKIIFREKKGFPVPTQTWFQGNLLIQVSEIVSKLKKEPWFRNAALEDLLIRHKAGVEDNSKLLMTLLVFEEWKRQYG